MKIAILSKLLPSAKAVEAVLDLVIPVLEKVQARHQEKAEVLTAKADSHREAAVVVASALHEKANGIEALAGEALSKADHALVLAERIKALRS